MDADLEVTLLADRDELLQRYGKDEEFRVALARAWRLGFYQAALTPNRAVGTAYFNPFYS